MLKSLPLFLFILIIPTIAMANPIMLTSHSSMNFVSGNLYATLPIAFLELAAIVYVEGYFLQKLLKIVNTKRVYITVLIANIISLIPGPILSPSNIQASKTFGYGYNFNYFWMTLTVFVICWFVATLLEWPFVDHIMKKTSKDKKIKMRQSLLTSAKMNMISYVLFIVYFTIVKIAVTTFAPSVYPYY